MLFDRVIKVKTSSERKLMLLQRVSEEWVHCTQLLGDIQTSAEWCWRRFMGGTWCYRHSSWCRVIPMAYLGMKPLFLLFSSLLAWSILLNTNLTVGNWFHLLRSDGNLEFDILSLLDLDIIVPPYQLYCTCSLLHYANKHCVWHVILIEKVRKMEDGSI